VHKIQIHNAGVAELVQGAILSRHRTVDALEKYYRDGALATGTEAKVTNRCRYFFWKDSRGTFGFLARESGSGKTSEGQKLVSRASVSEAEYLEGLSHDAVDRR
jgi:hypothetical protein